MSRNSGSWILCFAYNLVGHLIRLKLKKRLRLSSYRFQARRRKHGFLEVMTVLSQSKSPAPFSTVACCECDDFDGDIGLRFCGRFVPWSEMSGCHRIGITANCVCHILLGLFGHCQIVRWDWNDKLNCNKARDMMSMYRVRMMGFFIFFIAWGCIFSDRNRACTPWGTMWHCARNAKMASSAESAS